jgi:hypothetical protein
MGAHRQSRGVFGDMDIRSMDRSHDGQTQIAANPVAATLLPTTHTGMGTDMGSQDDFFEALGPTSPSPHDSQFDADLIGRDAERRIARSHVRKMTTAR